MWDKPCTDDEPFCCSDNTCAINEQACDPATIFPGITIPDLEFKECAPWDIICHLQNFWNWFVASITGFFASIGILAVIIVIIFVALFAMKRR